MLDFADTIAGYASYGRNRMPSLGYSGEIFELYLAPEYQGGGLGKRMFEAARAISPRMAFRLSSCGRWPATTAPSSFYRRLGGRIVRRARERFGAESRERVAFGFD